MTMRVAIIGAGYAGLTAAVELVRAGAKVSVFEASRTLGGRARVLEKDGLRLDNGQHILIGAYVETLSMMRSLDISPKSFNTLPFSLHVPGRLDLRAASAPAPFHLLFALLSAKGLKWADRFAMIRLMRFLQKRNYRLSQDCTVTELLNQTQQTALLNELIWEPLCIAALNTPASEASAQIFANVLRDSLAGGASASEFLIPRIDLSELLPVPAVRFLSTNGHPVHTVTSIKSIRHENDEFILEGAPLSDSKFSHVILAVAPYHASDILAQLPELALLREQIDALEHEPITTVYLAYDEHVRLPQPMMALSRSPIQWLFDRGVFYKQPGVIAGVISARGEHSTWSRDELALAAHRAIEALIPRLGAPKWTTVITEKRATFACRPGITRPSHLTPLRNLLLAGDYLDSPYPATIESAVRSGQTAARHIVRMTLHS